MVTTRHRLVTNIILVIFWITATYNFLIQEITRDEMATLELIVRLSGQMTLLCLGVLLLRKRVDILIVLTFVTLTLIGTCIVQGHSLFTWFDGLRNYVGYLFVLPIVRWLWRCDAERDHFVHVMERSLFIFLWLQGPCMILQYAEYANLDLVGGTLGWMMSGVISNLIYLISFYLMLRRWDYSKSYGANLKRNWILIFLLYPSLLNETKISFVYMLLYFLLLIPMDRNFVKRLVWILPATLLLLCGSIYAYSKIINYSGVSDISLAVYLVGDDAGLNMVEYIMENDSEDVINEDFARGLKLIVTPAIMDRQPGAWPWGYGLGQYKVGDSAKKSKFATRYYWLLRGTIVQMHYTWLETGLIGLGMYVIYWFLLLRVFKRKCSRNLQLQWMLGLMILIFSVYNPPFLVTAFFIIFIFLSFISSRWDKLPPYRWITLLGKRPIAFTWRDKETDTETTQNVIADGTREHS